MGMSFCLTQGFADVREVRLAAQAVLRMCGTSEKCMFKISSGNFANVQTRHDWSSCHLALIRCLLGRVGTSVQRCNWA
jgi:hypothetical protein